jgi:hypothetical protein
MNVELFSCLRTAKNKIKIKEQENSSTAAASVEKQQKGGNSIKINKYKMFLFKNLERFK